MTRKIGETEEIPYTVYDPFDASAFYSTKNRAEKAASIIQENFFPHDNITTSRSYPEWEFLHEYGYMISYVRIENCGDAFNQDKVDAIDIDIKLALTEPIEWKYDRIKKAILMDSTPENELKFQEVYSED